MINRPVATAQHKARAAKHISQLAKDVHTTFPDMDVHQHLHDAVRETMAGRHDNAKRHLDAAINAFTPLQLTRHGIHDDTGHMAGKNFMQRAHRGRLLVADAEHIANANLELHERQKDAQMQATQQAQAAKAAKAAAAPAAPRPGTAAVAAVVPATPIPPAKQLANGPQPYRRGPDETVTCPYCGKGDAPDAIYCDQCGRKLPDSAFTDLAWAGVLDTIELATFARAKPGSGKNFAKLSASLAKRGARNPGALAAYIGRKKYGKKGFAKLSHGKPDLDNANRAGGLLLAFDPDEPRGEHGRWMQVAGHIRRYQTASKNGDRAGATSALRDAESAATGPMRESLHRAVQAHASGDTYTAGLHVRKAATMMGGPPPQRLALANEIIELRYNPAQPRDTHGRWASTHASYHVGRVGPRQDAEGKFRQPGFGARHGNFGAAYKPGSLDHIRAVWDLGEEAGSHPENRSPTMRNALHNMARAMTRRDMRSARAHLAEAKVANRREAGGLYTRDLRALEDQLDRVPKTAAEWMPQANPLSYQGQHLGRYVDRTGEAPYNPTAGAMRQLTEMSNGWEDVLHAIELSADTGRLASEPHPFGKPSGPGLWGVKGMELPPYIQNIARALLRTGRAKSLSQAIAMAKGATARWATGKNTSPEVRAASAKTNASWAAKQATAHAHANGWDHLVDLTGTAAGASKDSRTPLGQFGSGGGAAQGKPQSRAQRKAALLAKAKQDRAQARLLMIRIAADRHALASASGKVTKGQKGATTTAKRSTTGSSAPAAKGPVRAASPTSNAATGLSPATITKATAAAKAQAGHMSKAQLQAAIKTMTTQEKNLLAAAAAAAGQAAKL